MTRHSGTRGVKVLVSCAVLAALLAGGALVRAAAAQDLGAESEDQRATALLKKGTLLYEANKKKEAVEMWQDVVNRFPRSKVRFSARLELGKHFLKERDTEKAIGYLSRAIEDTAKNENEGEVAQAMFLIGQAHFEAGEYARAFTDLRKVTSQFPGTMWCNEAYYYIGMGHFRLKNYKRAIEAFQMVGTSITDNDRAAVKIEGGRRLYIKVSDDDLLTTLGYENIGVRVTSGCGDEEQVVLMPVGLKGKVFVGSIACELANPVKGNGKLETWGHDFVTIEYIDKQAADKKHDVVRTHKIEVVGNAKLDFVDGALRKPVKGVVLDNIANIRLIDSDRDVSDQADKVKIILRVKEKVEGLERPKTIEEIEKQQELGTRDQQKYKVLQETAIDLVEYVPDAEGEKPVELKAGQAVHSGRFFARLAVVKKQKEGETKEGAETREGEKAAAKTGAEVQNLPTIACEEGNVLEIEYVDENSVASDKPVTLTAEASVFPGNLRPLSVFDRQIKDQELKVRTELKTAEAILQIGNIYKDLGLERKANEKFDLALDQCKQILKERLTARDLIEQTQVMLWKVYFAKGDLDAASRMCLTLLNTFPDSIYADEALLQMGKVSFAQKDYQRAISIYMRLLQVKNPINHAEAQFEIANCYEQMAQPKSKDQQLNRATYERALGEYKKVVDKYPNSKFAADAIMKIAEFYYNMKDYARATEIYTKAIEEYPDGQFLDRLLLNYGKSLLLMKRYNDAIGKFNQLISDYPQSKYVSLAKRYITFAEERASSGGASGGGAEGGSGGGAVEEKGGE